MIALAMANNTHDFVWLEQHELYRVGQGNIVTPYENFTYRVKEPRELADDHPIAVFPGFTDGIDGTDRLTNALAECGRFAVSLNYPRSENPDFKDDPEGHKVHSGILVLDALGEIEGLEYLQDEADAVGHSEGGSNASRACIEHPEYFRTLIAMASGGLIEGDTVRKITLRAMRNPQTFLRLTGQLLTHPGHTVKLVNSANTYVQKNPVKARNEAVQIASRDIRCRFPVLSNKKGIPNAALQFYNDVIFPYHLVARDTDNGNIFDIFSRYPHDDATHTTPQAHPRTTANVLLEINQGLVEIAQNQSVAA